MSRDSLLCNGMNKKKVPMEKEKCHLQGTLPRLYMKYIGETKRTIKKRLTEHRFAVKKGEELNGIAVHVHKYQHVIDWDSARVSAVHR